MEPRISNEITSVRNHVSCSADHRRISDKCSGVCYSAGVHPGTISRHIPGSLEGSACGRWSVWGGRCWWVSLALEGNYVPREIGIDGRSVVGVEERSELCCGLEEWDRIQ